MNAQSALAGNSVDAFFPFTGDGYSTLGINVHVEESDIQNYNVDHWTESSHYYKDGDPQQVTDSVVVKMPAVGGDFGYYLDFAGAPPVPPQKVGTWSVTALLTLGYFTCHVVGGIPVCGEAFFCVLYGASEPCEDMASGYIH